MAVISMQKIKLVASGTHRQKLLDSLQSLGALEVTEIADEKDQSPEKMEALHATELNIANIDFALKLVKPYAKHRNLIQGPLVLTIDDVKKKAKEFNFNTVIKQCRTVEENMVALKNELAALEMLQ